MSQSRKYSFIEACCNIAVGYFVAIISQLVIFWMFDIQGITLSQNFLIGLWFTLISLCRSYILRRIFNKVTG